MRKIVLIIFLQAIVTVGIAQELMTRVEDADVVQLFDLPAVVALTDGNKFVGTVDKAYMTKGYLNTVTLKLQDGTTRKFKPAEMESVKIRCKVPTMFSVVDNDGNPIKKVIYTQYVFEHPNKSDKMQQLLNPVYDSRIKIFADPNGSQGSTGINIKGVAMASTLTAYLVIKGSEVFYIKAKNYDDEFQKLYGDCEKMTEATSTSQKDMSAIASHLLLYDFYCGQVK